MPRLFTALDLPDATLDPVRAFQETADLPAQARWTPLPNHHITLRFIGDVDASQAERIESALRTVSHPPFTVEPLGLGVLPSRRTPRVLTVRIEPTPPLQHLYDTLQDVLASVDIAPEARPYRPHITLARLKRVRPERLYTALRDLDGPGLRPFRATHFYLYESTLTPDGAVHAVRARYALGA